MTDSAEDRFTIRPARAEDEERVLELLKALGGEKLYVTEGTRAAFKDVLDGSRGSIRVVDDGGKVAGMISFSFNLAMRYGGEYAQIEELIVDEAYRGYGLGALLVEASITAARERGCKEMGLYAGDHNRPFYEKCGFVFEGSELRQALSG